MRLTIERSQRDEDGGFFGAPHVEFTLGLHLEISDDERRDLQRYALNPLVMDIDEDHQIKPRDGWGRMKGPMYIGHLLSGGSWISPRLASLLAVEDAALKACRALSVELQVYAAYQGQTIIDIP